MAKPQISEDALRILKQRHRTIRDNPRAFCIRELGRDVWQKQAEIMDLVANNKRIAVASSNAVGKSYLAALLVPWYLFSRPLGYVVTTGNSWKGLSKILWPEIHRIVTGARNEDIRDSGVLNDMDWKLGNHWGAFAVSPNREENMGGFRTPGGVMVIVDEASMLSYPMMEAIEGLCAAEGSIIFMIGNPLRPDGPFYDAFKSPLWATMHISALETPNYKAGKNLIPGLATREWVQERLIDWGTESPAYQARVLGQFPERSTDIVIPLILAEAAAGRQASMEGPVCMGVDVARFGDDNSVIQIIKGKTALPPDVIHGQDTMQIAGRVVAAINEHHPSLVHVDEIGIGAGVVDRLIEMRHGNIVRGINVATAANDTTRYANLRVEGWYAIKEWLQDGGAIPNDRALLGELCSARYKFSSSGRQILEEKGETKKRLGRSPDKADALMLALVRPKSTGRVGLLFEV